MNVYILSIINLNPQVNFLIDTYFDTMKISESEGIFKKITSYLTSSRQIHIEKEIFILNPSNNGMIYKNNNKLENCVFLINENIIKIVAFSFVNNRIKPEVYFK